MGTPRLHVAAESQRAQVAPEHTPQLAAAQERDREFRLRLALAAGRCHQACTPHSRQYFEEQLAGRRSFCGVDRAFALAAIGSEEARWCLAAYLPGLAEPDGVGPVSEELARLAELSGRLQGQVARAMPDGIDGDEYAGIRRTSTQLLDHVASLIRAAAAEAGETGE
jgi:hypothetical protein